jgi:LysM repeat protein
MSPRLYLSLAAALGLAGCSQLNKETTQTDGSSSQAFKQAQQDLDNNNPSAAIADYEAALASDPKLAGAHYELGVVYADKMNDPVSSIYHFKRFLDLSPNSDKKEQVQAMIDKQGAIYAATLPNSGPSPADMTKLQDENASLKKEVDDASTTITKLQAQLSKLEAVAAKQPSEAPTGPMLAQAGTSTAPDPSAPVSTDATGMTAVPAAPAGTNAPAATPPKALPVDAATAAAGNADTQPGGTNSAPVSLTDARSYKVVKGDSYWKIAKKMYPGDTKNGVQKIEDANKETVGKPLKIGQVLVIPK